MKNWCNKEYFDITQLDILNFDVDKFNELIQRHLRFVPGLSLAVVTEAGVYATGAGRKSVVDSSEVFPETLFYISSLTKVMTALLVMKLVESGVLDINESVYTYVPDFRFRNLNPDDRITLEDLLTHTSGWPDLVPAYYATSNVSLKEHVYEELSQVRIVTPPHGIFNYSSANYNLLGFICEIVTGLPFSQLLKQFLDSIGMSQTHYNYQEAYTLKTMAMGHNAELRSFSLSPHIQDHPGFYPSTQLLSNVLDLSQIVRLFLGEGQINGQSYLNPVTIQKMMTPKVRVYTNRGDCYGMGLCLKTRRDPIVLHEGIGLGSFSRMYLIPQRKIGVVLLANSQLYGLTSKITHYLLDKFPIVSNPMIYRGFSPLDSPSESLEHQQFAPYYFATNGQPVAAQMSKSDDGWYITLRDLSTGETNEGKLINNEHNGFYTVINALQRKVGFGTRDHNGLVSSLVIGTIAYTQVDGLCPKVLSEGYKGSYVGFLEDSCQEMTIHFSVNPQEELIAALSKDNFKLVPIPYLKHTFASKIGRVEFLAQDGVVYGLRISDVLRFEKIA
ncbi:beta-lactamase family protein [Paenibacillus sp. EKM208P]|nr:beta-lactamase family protein [Paenibacillus sp. EKM208P]